MASTPSSELAEGPVMTCISKRIRALKKKLNRIVQMEEALAQGKSLNKEQEEVFRSKTSVVCAIEELEKILPSLSAAVSEEISFALKNYHNDQSIAEADPVERLLNLIYFGATFDLHNQNDLTSMMLAREHERQSCISYDTVLDVDNATDMLCESDLDLVAKLGNLMISRPVDSSFSHKESLQKCIQHAKQWLTKSEQPIDSDTNITYAELSAKLNKIIASGYFTAIPQIKATVDIAAAAVGSYTFPVPVETILASSEVDGSVVKGVEPALYPENGNVVSHLSYVEEAPKGEEPAVYQENVNGVSHFSYVEEAPKVQYQLEDHSTDLVENGSATYQEEDQNAEEFKLKPYRNRSGRSYNNRGVSATYQEDDQNPEDLEQKQYQNGSRRSYNNRGGQGGGRRGFPNGRGARGSSRGGGPYKPSGRSQYYENGQFYPRSYYNKGRGGGGRGGGGAQSTYAAAES